MSCILLRNPPDYPGEPDSIGKTLTPCEITAMLGKGGMGEVYRATDTDLPPLIGPHPVTGSMRGAAS